MNRESLWSVIKRVFSGSRVRSVGATAYDEARASDTVTWSLSYATGPRPWREMWNSVEAGLQELRAYYSGQLTVTDSTKYTDDIANFFVMCAHLRDHLVEDPAVTVPAQTIQNFFWSSNPLSLTGDFADTWKHHTRRQRGRNRPLPRTVKIGSIYSNFRVTVVWTDPATGGQHSQDVLALAEEAVNDWQGFFQLHSI